MKLTKSLLIGIILSMLILSFSLVGCAKKTPELGTEENPVIWSFVASIEMERVAAGARAVAGMLFDKTGYYFKTNVATEYAGVIQALKRDPTEAHMASLATFAYVMAADAGIAEAALVSVRFGSPTYNSQFIVRKNSGINSVADLQGKSFARPDPLSTSGWIIPMLTMRAAGIDTETGLSRVIDAGSHEAVIAAVFNGDADAGATYVDARSRVEDDFPTVMDEVVVIAVTVDIPNDGVQFHPSIPREMRDKIVTALLEIAATDEGKDALNEAYQWNDLMKKDDTFYDHFRQVLKASGLSINELN